MGIRGLDIITNAKTYCLDKTVKGDQEILIYVPGANEVLEISVGTGEQLLPEDRADGWVDYLYVESFEYVGASETDCGFKPGDGDIWLRKEYIDDIQSVLYEYLCYRYGKCPEFVVMQREVG